jgi:hypothetical protein
MWDLGLESVIPSEARDLKFRRTSELPGSEMRDLGLGPSANFGTTGI